MTSIALPLRYRVAECHSETAETATLTLHPVTESIGPFAPGQFTMLTAFGIGEIPISIGGDPADPVHLVQTIREVGPVSRRIRRSEVGDLIGIRGPFGTTWPVRRAAGRDLVFIAGGIGLAPLRPAILQALAEPHRYRRIAVLVGARRPCELLYRDELECWHKTEELDLAVTVDRPDPGWHGDVGLVTALLDRACGDPASTSAFVCGPEPMMRAVGRELVRRDVPAEAVAISLERNMRCGNGLCGHCQLGPMLLCRDGPVVRLDVADPLLDIEEL